MKSREDSSARLARIGGVLERGASRARRVISTVLSGGAVSGVRPKVSAVLNRRVLTESDKKTLRGLKAQVANDSRTKTILLAKARVTSSANMQTAIASLKRAFWSVGDLVPDEASRWVHTEANRRRYSAAKKQLLDRTLGFRRWMKKPVTVSTVLASIALWALAIVFSRSAFPWSEIGFNSGWAAIFMTAVVATRLTVNSQKLWLDAPWRQAARKRRRELVAEVDRWLKETSEARRTLVLQEVLEFVSASGLSERAREVNPKANTFLMRKKDWQALQDALYDTFLKGAPPLLHELGHRLGTLVGRDLMRLGKEPGAMLTHLGEISQGLGWGTVTVQGDLARGSKLTYTVRESPFCVTDSPLVKNTRTCDTLVGMMTGISEEVYGWPCSSYEQKCVREGHDGCKIVVNPAMARPAQKQKWNLSVLFPALYPWSR